MFNLQPGQGLGRGVSRRLAFGLGAIGIQVVVIRVRPGAGQGPPRDWTVRRIAEEEELLQIVIWIVTGWME